MKAVWVEAFAPFESITVKDVADPVPAMGEVVIDVKAAEANYPDILVIEGKYQIKPALPFAPGKCAAGTVAALGSGVTHLKIGDPVVAQTEYGAYAEKLKVRAESCFRMPSGMAFDEGAALGLVYQTAWFALRERAAFKAGDIVLVLGASGGIGVASIQLAKAMGARMVIGGVLGESNAAIARTAGADATIDLGADDLRDSLRVQINHLTDGHGADIVIDPVGGDAHAAALRAMAWCGRMVIIGFASGNIPTIKANYLLVKNIAVTGLQWSDYRDRTPELVITAQDEIFKFASAGQLKPIISRRLPLKDFAQGLTALRDGQAQGKIILTTDTA